MKLASIETIKSIEPHTNADSLEFAILLNYRCIVRKGQFSVGDNVVFIQPDTVLPDTDWAKIYKAKSSRVKAMRLRGQWSQGIVEPCATFYPVNLTDIAIGSDIADLIGVKKYEPPVPQNLDAKGPLRFGLSKTDEERWENLDPIPYGKEVIVTLKIDGQSASFFAKQIWEDKSWEKGITSRNLELKPESNNTYTAINKKYNILDKLGEYCGIFSQSYCLRGECYGHGIQSFNNNPHSKLPLNFAAFSLFNLNTLQYETFDYCAMICNEIGVPTVPIIERATLTPELIKKYSEDLTEINGQPFEGVVVKGDNFSFKIINKAYDSKK